MRLLTDQGCNSTARYDHSPRRKTDVMITDPAEQPVKQIKIKIACF